MNAREITQKILFSDSERAIDSIQYELNLKELGAINNHIILYLSNKMTLASTAMVEILCPKNEIKTYSITENKGLMGLLNTNEEWWSIE